MRSIKLSISRALEAACFLALLVASEASASTAPREMLPVHMANATVARQQNACHKLAYQFGLGAPDLLMELARECNMADPNDCVNARILTGGQSMSPFKHILKCSGRSDN